MSTLLPSFIVFLELKQANFFLVCSAYFWKNLTISFPLFYILAYQKYA